MCVCLASHWVTQAKKLHIGRVTGDVSVLELFYEVGQDNLRDDVEVTTLTGLYHYGESPYPKVMCLKHEKMIKGSITDKQVHSVHACFGQLTGKSSFEMQQKDDSSGVATPESDVNLLTVFLQLRQWFLGKPWQLSLCMWSLCATFSIRGYVWTQKMPLHGHVFSALLHRVVVKLVSPRAWLNTT